MNTNVCFVTDTGADFPREVENIIRVPLHFMFGDKSYEDESLTDQKFELMSALEWPKTSGPSAGEFKKAFERALEMGYRNILCLPISIKLSGSHDTALLAASDLTDHKDVQIGVVDTKSLTLGVGYLVEMLVGMLEKPGITLQELVKAATNFHNNEHIYIALNTLENLFKGGRATRTQKQLSSLLKIKPILTLDSEGNLDAISKIRTFSKALSRVIEYVLQKPNIKKAGVMYSDNKKLAETFAANLAEVLKVNGISLKVPDIPVVQVCRALRVHAGSNAVGVCVVN